MKKEFITEKGTVLYWHVTYNLGGQNVFSGQHDRRGYSLFIQRKKNSFAVGLDTGLNHESGAVRYFLHEVNRKSKKQEQIANDMVTDEELQRIANIYGV